MSQSTSTLSFFFWKLEPKFSFGFIFALLLISSVFGAIWKMFPALYLEHQIFAFFHHFLAVLTLVFMFLASWASPGRVVASPQTDPAKSDEPVLAPTSLDSTLCTVTIGITAQPNPLFD